jgi:hypothetical protein
MSKKFDIKPPTWSKELTFEEFQKLNPLINENQIINLYNQYLSKFLNELRQQKLHFKQSKNTQLVSEIQDFKTLKTFDDLNSRPSAAGAGGAGGFSYTCLGIGCYIVGAYSHRSLTTSPVPVDEGYPRFTVGRPVAQYLPYINGGDMDTYRNYHYGSPNGPVNQTDWDPPEGDASGLNP